VTAVFAALIPIALLPAAANAGNIHDAVRSRDVQRIDELLAQSPGLITSRDDSQRLPLHWAALGGDVAIIEKVFESSLLSEGDFAGFQPLHLAAMGQLEATKWLIQQGADVGARSKEGLRPLDWAARAGTPDIIRYLVQSGASLDAKTILGAALANAATAERVENARALIELGADVDGEAAVTPLSFASAKGNTELVSLLLRHRADPNRRLSKGRTALHVAAINGRRAVVELLLEAGADRSIRDSAGRRALDEALERGHADIVAMLEGAEQKQ
jgi:ankyrin repeat protein